MPAQPLQSTGGVARRHAGRGLLARPHRFLAWACSAALTVQPVAPALAQTTPPVSAPGRQAAPTAGTPPVSAQGTQAAPGSPPVSAPGSQAAPAPGTPPVSSPETAKTDAAQGDPPPLKPEELQQLAAPIALYPDALLAQTLMASTYPLEVVQAARWVKEHEKLKGEELEKAVQKQPWDPSVRSLCSFPQVLTMMNEKLDWTQKLGDAFLAQENELMAAVQTLRGKAKKEGNLKSTKEQNVKVEKDETGKTEIIVIESSNPQVVYVPTYNPSVVYGAWPYPAYPPYYYYPPGYAVAAGAAVGMISFGVGMAVGAAMWGGVGWGYRGGSVQINNVNNFNRVNNTNINSNKWQHNSSHRKGVQYRDNATAQRFDRGGNAGAGQRQSYRGRSGAEGRAGAQGRSAAEGRAGAQGRSGNFDRGGGSRTQSGNFQRDASGQRGSAFQGSGSGGRQARMESSRGSSSRGSFSGGGGARGGGMRGGGGRRR